MRYAARRDANERDIIDSLRAVGAVVQPLDAKGVPDLLVGFRGVTYLLEVKDSEKPPSARKLTPDQATWHKAWTGGLLAVVETVDEAYALIGAKERHG